jgi:hypothetical protein
MKRNKKAESRGNGSDPKNLMRAVKQIRFPKPDYVPTWSGHQCKMCGSDYMREAVDDICQRCLQREEFSFRERVDTSEPRRFQA